MNPKQANISGKVDVNITKVLTYAVVGLAVIGIAFFIYRKTRKGISSLKEKAEQADVVREAKRSVKQSELTKDKIWYESSADRLKEAMQGPGTTEKTIYDIFGQLQTNDDLKQLIAAFGTRSGKSGTRKFTGNLATWLESELSNREFDKVNKILTNNNITLRL